MSKSRGRLLDQIERVLEHPDLPEPDRIFVQRSLELGSPKDAALELGYGSDGIMRLARLKQKFMPQQWKDERASLRSQTAEDPLRKQLRATIQNAIKRARAILQELGSPRAVRKIPAGSRASLLRAAMVATREGERLLRSLRAPGPIGPGGGPQIAVSFDATPPVCPACGHDLRHEAQDMLATLRSGGRVLEPGGNA